MSIIDFKHYQHAHCESGVTSNLLKFEGIDVSEPMVFGIGSGIFFAHLSFVKVSGTPGSTFRTFPGTIFKQITKRLNIEMEKQRFRTPEAAMQALDDVLAQGKPVGMGSSVYYLPYLPEAFRFHFNAHNLVVYGKEGDEYLVSDPILEDVSRIKAEDLAKARFAKGFPEPKGLMYYVKSAPKEMDFPKAIKAGIKQTCFFMLSPPLPWFGNKGIFHLANQIQKYPKKLTPRKSALYLGNVIRMQEEIGTGGAGFRFLYAAFLQEAGEMLQRDDLKELSEELTVIGDDWRNFAYHSARQMKNRTSDLVSYDELADMLRVCGTKEKDFFTRLGKIKW
ncbi:MAG: BtrH N-terminal domain-containing protein [Flavipsychrobacter sp.]